MCFLFLYKYLQIYKFLLLQKIVIIFNTMITLEKPNLSHKIAYEKMRQEWEQYENIFDTSP